MGANEGRLRRSRRQTQLPRPIRACASVHCNDVEVGGQEKISTAALGSLWGSPQFLSIQNQTYLDPFRPILTFWAHLDPFEPKKSGKSMVFDCFQSLGPTGLKFGRNFGNAPGQIPKLILTLCLNSHLDPLDSQQQSEKKVFFVHLQLLVTQCSNIKQ